MVATARWVSPVASPLLLRRGDPLPRRGQAVGERALRPPAELARRERRIEDAALQLSEPRGCERRLPVDAARRADRVEQSDDRRLDACADVEDAAVAFEREEHRARYVADVDVIARL